MQFKTTEIYLSGGICGYMWMPDVLAGRTFRQNARGVFGFMERFSEPATVKEALEAVIIREGGDFRNPKFTSDTELVFVRKAIDGPGKYRVHARSIPISRLVDPDCIEPDFMAGDFFNDD